MQTRKRLLTLWTGFLQLVASLPNIWMCISFQRVLKNNNAWAASARPAFPQQISFGCNISSLSLYLTTITTEENTNPVKRVLGRVSDTRGRPFSLCELDISVKTDDSWYKISPHKWIWKLLGTCPCGFISGIADFCTTQIRKDDSWGWAYSAGRGQMGRRQKNAKHHAAMVS